MTTAALDATQSNNARRQVFYQYPQGAAPLMGLLAHMEGAEEVDKQTFFWYEDREVLKFDTTAQANSAGPFTDTTGVSGAVGTDLTAAGWTSAAATTIRIKVVDATKFRVRDVIWIKDINGTVSSLKQLRGIVDTVWTAQNTIDVRLQVTVTNAINNTTNNSFRINIIGTASVEGGYSKLGGTTFPIEPGNYTQIFRTVVGPFSRNALKQGQNFDDTGIYKHYAKKAHLRHMELQEEAALWGIRGTNSVTDSDDNVAKVEKTTGGVLWFLQQWELGTVSNGAQVEYRPGGSDITATSWSASDDKRVCVINGSVTYDQFYELVRRIFTYTSDTGFEKLVLCGAGFLGQFTRMAEKNSIKVVQMNDKEDTYGISLTMWETPFGTLYFKSHPLFTHNPIWTFSAMVLDMGSIKYHPFQDADSMLLTNRQARDFDGRKDEWLTEYGIEINFPERHMYIENMTSITI